MKLRIPVLDLGPEIEELWPEINEAFARVVRSGHFILGPEVRAFEEEAAAYLGCKYAIGVNSGTDAIVIALRAFGVGPGHEVITTPFSFFATAEGISNVGATPVFVDIDENTLNIDPDLIEAAITPRTRVIMPVHLFGRPAEMNAIMEIAAKRDVIVLEDCAQSFGATHGRRRAGAIGQAAAFSFFPTKNLGAFGDGGMITTDDDALAQKIRMLRSHGSKRKYHNEILGYNSRLDALQAAFLRIKLAYVDRFNEGRRRVASAYDESLAEVDGIVTPSITDGHVFHQYTIRVPGGRRDALQAGLADEGIGSMVYYPIPQDKLPVYAEVETHCPVSDQAAGEVLSLPIWPSLSNETAQEVARAIQRLMRVSETQSVV